MSNIRPQRPILPAQPQGTLSSNMSGDIAADDHKSVREVIETLQEGKQGIEIQMKINHISS